MRFAIIICFLIGTCLSSIGQTLPISRSVDWTLAGLRDTNTIGFNVINMQSMGAVGDGITPNDSILFAVIIQPVVQGQ